MKIILAGSNPIFSVLAKSAAMIGELMPGELSSHKANSSQEVVEERIIRKPNFRRGKLHLRLLLRNTVKIFIPAFII